MLDLSRVTLLFVETRAHKITQRVIADCLSKARFGGLLIYTDRPELFQHFPGVRTEVVPDFDTKKAAGQFYYQYACAKIETDFALMLEWDAGIHDVSAWNPEFFNYDVIGAPWNVKPNEHDKLDVGNGGFMLMSKKLGIYLSEHQRDVPVFTDWDLCRGQRGKLEMAGFKFAPRDIATQFSWELTYKPETHFGYHATFTWPFVLDEAEVVYRAKLMLETPYLTSKMGDLIRKAPWIEDALTPTDQRKYFDTNPRVPLHPQARVFPNRARLDMQKLVIKRRNEALAQLRGGKA